MWCGTRTFRDLSYGCCTFRDRTGGFPIASQHDDPIRWVFGPTVGEWPTCGATMPLPEVTVFKPEPFECESRSGAHLQQRKRFRDWALSVPGIRPASSAAAERRESSASVAKPGTLATSPRSLSSLRVNSLLPGHYLVRRTMKAARKGRLLYFQLSGS
jgi:hypothetical protein